MGWTSGQRMTTDRNYVDTFIAVADDCKTDVAVTPKPRGSSATIAQLQYQMLSEPFVYTQEEVLFEVWLARQGTSEVANDERALLKKEFFAKGHACLRASPLTKTHGWGVLFDANGKASLVACESEEYQRHLNDESLQVLKALRSKRDK